MEYVQLDYCTYEQVPEVPDCEVTDWKHVHDALAKQILRDAEDKLESSRRYFRESGFDQGSEISGDTNDDLCDLFWQGEAVPLFEALLKLDPGNAVLQKLLERDHRPHGDDLRDAFAADPVLGAMQERMGASWTLNAFPLCYRGFERMSGVVKFLDAFEFRVVETLKFIAFPRPKVDVFAALGLGRRFVEKTAQYKTALHPLPERPRAGAAYSALRERYLA